MRAGIGWERPRYLRSSLAVCEAGSIRSSYRSFEVPAALHSGGPIFSSGCAEGGSSGGSAARLRESCAPLIVAEFLDASGHAAKADRLHEQIHDSVEGLVLEHLGVCGQEPVPAEPERKSDQQNREKEWVIERIGGWPPSRGPRCLRLRVLGRIVSRPKGPVPGVWRRVSARSDRSGSPVP